MKTLNELRFRAQQSLRAGRIDDAIADHRALLEQHPGDADAWYNLGYLLRCGRYERLVSGGLRYRNALKSIFAMNL